MANNFSPSFIEVWAKEMETVFYKVNVALKIADMSFNGQLAKGDVLNRVYRSTNPPQVYVRGTDITIDDKTDTGEQLTVNAQYANGFYVDDFDQIQDNYNIAMTYGKDNGEFLSNQIDADVLGEVINSTSTIDASLIGGTAGNGLTLSTSNVIKVLGAAKRALKRQNVQSNDLVGAISPEFEDILTQYVESKYTVLGDKVGENGYIGMYMGINFYVSNNLTGSAVLSLATQPTANDTVTIAGQVFTFVAAIGTTPGNVLIGANVDVTRASLTALINSPSTTNTTQVALTGNNLRVFQNGITAVNSNSADTMTVTQKGAGVIVVSETLTDVTDTWTAAKQIQYNMVCVRGNPVVVVQREPTVQMKEEPKKLGKNVLNGVLYGYKTFQDNAKQMVNIKIASSTF